jgi:8-oxo-dGTP pyrophosphatase MutT (NUDIX family)
MMKIFKNIALVLLSLVTLVSFGYFISLKNNSAKINWQKISTEESAKLLATALENGAWDKIDEKLARNTLSKHLDAAKIPNGDLAVPGQTIHSKRYVISQWQRVAAGAIVVVLGRDKDGMLNIALGPQRGFMNPPQGYMEASLPTEDLSGLGAKGASRLKGNEELVNADNNLEDTALREVKEELGLVIDKNKLHLIGISSSREDNPIVHTVAAHYGVFLTNTPPLATTDHEFADDDISNPEWFKIRDISCDAENCYVGKAKKTIKKNDIPVIQNAIKQLGTMADQKDATQLISFVIKK